MDDDSPAPGSDVRVRSEFADGILTVTLDRPDRLNAVTAQTLTRFLELIERAEADDVAVVVVTGAGKAFSSGQDLQELDTDLAQGTDADFRDHLALFQSVTQRILAHPKPFIAAINGVAVGFGAELALACDVRLASTQARIGFVEATRALFQTNGVMWLLPRIIGHGNAAHLLLSGSIVDAEEAHRIGLVSRVYGPDELPAATRELAERIRDNAPISVRLVKRVLGVTWEERLDQVMAREVDGMLDCIRSEDLAEGTRAFLEGRPPRYQGR